MRAFLLFSVPFIFVSCATKMSLSTNPPGAKVFAGDAMIGTTPVDLATDNLQAQVAGGFLVRIERTGYKSAWFWFPEGVSGLEVSLNLKPLEYEPNAIDLQVNISRRQLDLASARLLRAQSKLLMEDGSDLAELTQLQVSLPRLGVTSYLKGVAHFKAGDQTQALEELKEALKLSPSEPDYSILLQQLEKN